MIIQGIFTKERITFVNKYLNDKFNQGFLYNWNVEEHETACTFSEG